MPSVLPLAEAMTDSQTFVKFASSVDWAQSGIFQIENEKIKFTFASDFSVVNCTRGYAGTTAATHTAAQSATFLAALTVTDVSSVAQEIVETYGDVNSHQTVAADLNVLPGVGSADGSDPSFIAAIMGNLIAEDPLTADANYLAGVIGAYNVLGEKATSYPAGGVLGIIGDGVEEADGAVVAVLDGDSAQTNARAAFTVLYNNSVPGSGFEWGVDLKGDAHDGYAAVEFLEGELRFSNGTKITVSGDTIVFTNDAGDKSTTLTMTA